VRGRVMEMRGIPVVDLRKAGYPRANDARHLHPDQHVAVHLANRTTSAAHGTARAHAAKRRKLHESPRAKLRAERRQMCATKIVPTGVITC
jgi:hypothetical protein